MVTCQVYEYKIQKKKFECLLLYDLLLRDTLIAIPYQPKTDLYNHDECLNMPNAIYPRYNRA